MRLWSGDMPCRAMLPPSPHIWDRARVLTTPWTSLLLSMRGRTRAITKRS